jgi:hypothetical protein
MKKFIKVAFVFAGLLLMILNSCKKFGDEFRLDPNKATTASGTQLIANAEMWLPDISSSPFGVHYPQHLSNTSFTDNSRYTTVSFNFYNWYSGPLMNLQTVLNAQLNANEGPVVNQVAVAKILKAYFFWFLTDRFGDIPYNEALKTSKDFTPKYDKQKDIYDSLFKLLDEANASITTGANTNIKNDIVYNGDMSKWKKFGNTIHMLMGLRLSKVDAVKGAAEFTKALNNGIMTANSDNFVYQHLAEQPNENFWYTQMNRMGRLWYAVSKPLVDYMLPLNDPRLPVFANKNAAGNYVGLDYGLPGSTTVVINNYSLLGDKLRLQNAPVYLVTYAQALFAKAEAAKLGWIAGGDVEAKTDYELAIQNSILQWTGSTTGASTYINQSGVLYDPTKAIQQIATQRWVHLFLHGYEAWAEWRRTGYPLLVAAPGANGNKIPRREGYPVLEASLNTENYNAAVASFPYGGADDLNARVWWDK